MMSPSGFFATYFLMEDGASPCLPFVGVELTAVDQI